jgi:NitT/TauT family transport system permease protein
MAQWRSRLGIPATAVGMLALWQVLSWLTRSQVLPSPSGVVYTFFAALGNGSLAEHLLVSTYRVTFSIVLAVAIGLPAGLSLGLSERLYRLSSPLIYLTYPVTKIVLLPVLLLFLGIGESSKIALLLLILFFQVLIVVRDAARGVRPELVYSVRSLGARRFQLLWHVYLPASLPGLLTALRITVGTAIAVLFFAESFGTSSGLGYYILVEGWGRLAYKEMYAGVLAMALLGLVLYVLLDLMEQRLCRWTRAGA